MERWGDKEWEKGAKNAYQSLMSIYPGFLTNIDPHLTNLYLRLMSILSSHFSSAHSSILSFSPYLPVSPYSLTCERACGELSPLRCRRELLN